MANRGPELRIGLVLYGGVSLAVYIYGVVVEVQRLLRAARELNREPLPEPLSPYAGALRDAGISAVTVDIVAGTSAGGINGILLAKALASGTDVGSVADIWLEGGDIEQLLQPPSVADPRALLQSRQFEDRLHEGLRRLDFQGGSGRNEAPAAPVLDLFVSSTHLRGGRRVFFDSLGEQIGSRQHRYVFRLKLRQRRQTGDGQRGYAENDFRPADNPKLVKLARATSAFPVAFRPVEIDASDKLLEEGEGGGWFADGGILNNKPFTEAVETIVGRRSDRPVKRWLLSVDPDPVPLGGGDGAGEEPSFDQIALSSVATIPRYQSIVRDLAALRAHNEKVDAAAAAVLEGELELAGSGEGELPLPSPPAYLELRRQAWGIAVADRLLEAVRAGRDSGYDPLAVHRTFRRVAEGVFSKRQAALPDLALQRRRAYYLIKLVGMAEAVETPPPRRKGDPEDTDDVRSLLWEEFEALSDAFWQGLAGERLDLSDGPSEDGIESRARERLEDAIPAMREALGDSDNRLRERLGRVRLRLAHEGAEAELTIADVLAGFERRDAMLLPAEVYGGLRQRDRVEHAQVSPAAATNTGVPRASKLAGVTLGHFGGFLDARWRANDLMWGRLDGAETLVRAILEGAEEDPDRQAGLVGRHTDAVQVEILDDELEELRAGSEPGWKERLLEHAGAGPSFSALDPRRMLGVGTLAASTLRRMLRTAAEAAAAGGAGGRVRAFGLRFVANALGFLLALLYLPLTAFFDRAPLGKRLAVVVALLPTLWGLATLALGILGVFELSDVAGPAAVGIAVYPLFVLVYWGVALVARRLRRTTAGGADPPSVAAP